MLVKDVRVVEDFSDGRSINGLLYFGGDDGTVTEIGYSDGETGLELWRSDGTEEGTVRLTDIAPGAAWSNPKYMTEVGGHIYFRADDGFHGNALWRIPVAHLPGDADGNGVVDFSDFLRLSTNFGRQGTPVTMPPTERDSAALSTMVDQSLAEDPGEEHVPAEMLDAVTLTSDFGFRQGEFVGRSHRARGL